MIGQLVGHYRVLEKIGAGGMGEVYRARDERLGRDVALKLIRPASSDNPDHLRRFEQEARAAAALNHPNIVAIFDVGFEGKTPYIVSELLEGKTLRVRLGEGTIPAKEASGYALQIAQGLTAAHDRHIVHRDLKPENLFITNDGRIKILDFGVAKLQAAAEDNASLENLPTVTKHGAIIGTVAYMSPEQLRGKPVDHRSDIFSFGAILYEMLSSHRAFRGETEVDTMTAVLLEEPPGTALDQAAIPPGYQDIVRHCVEKEADNRFQSAKDLVFALQTLSGSSQVSTIVLPRPKSKTRSRIPWAIVAILVVVVAGLALMQIFRSSAQSPEYTRITFEAGTIYSARFTPDGNVLYSAAWDNKPTKIFSTVANSLLSQPLSFPNANLLGVSRKDELALAVGGIHSGQMETVNGMLARAALAGSSPRDVLSEVRWADWDPQGQLAVVHFVDGQCRLEFPIGHTIYQTGGWISHIRFNAHGDQIAFMYHPALWDTRGDVRVTDLTGHVRALTGQWDSEAGLAWSPNGKEIWFSAIDKGHDLNLVAVDLSGKSRQVLDLPGSITLHDIAPDGRVLIALNSQRIAMAFTSMDRKEDIDLSSHDSNSPRDITGDGQFLEFEDSSEAAGPGYAVEMRRVDGALPTRLGEGSAGGLSPDEKWAISIPTSGATQITLLPTGAGQPRTIAVTGVDHIHNGWARFLPDSQHIAVVAEQKGHAPRCFLVDVSTGKTNSVTPDGVVCGPLSPDGHFIAQSRPSRTLTLYSLDGGKNRVVADLQHDFNPVQWSNDGNSLYGYHWGEFPANVYKLDISTGKETLLHELKPGASAGVVLVAPVIATRDGKYFAYSYNHTLSVLYLISGLH